MNNPVEKHLSTKAIQDRWTFLAYYDKEYPFSEKPELSGARWALRDAMKVVEHEYKCGRYLRYTLLYRLFEKLNPLEKEHNWRIISSRHISISSAGCASTCLAAKPKCYSL